MTPEQFMQCRLAVGLTQQQAANMLGYGSRSRISEIETGKRNSSKAVVRLMRAYVDGYRPDDWPDVEGEAP